MRLGVHRDTLGPMRSPLADEVWLYAPPTWAGTQLPCVASLGARAHTSADVPVAARDARPQLPAAAITCSS